MEITGKWKGYILENPERQKNGERKKRTPKYQVNNSKGNATINKDRTCQICIHAEEILQE